jgi:hypothetical protein
MVGKSSTTESHPQPRHLGFHGKIFTCPILSVREYVTEHMHSMLVLISFFKFITVRCSGPGLSSQHLGGWGRRISSLRPACTFFGKKKKKSLLQKIFLTGSIAQW